jgi:hypothetical protein
MSVYNKWIAALLPVTRRMFMILLALIHTAAGQQRVECDDSGLIGFTVRSVVVKGRWISKSLRQKVEEVAGLGSPYDPLKASNAQIVVEKALAAGEDKYVIGTTGSTSVLYIDQTVCDISDFNHPKQVEIVIRAYYIRVDLYNVGNNILPVPRGIKPTLYSGVPDLLLATSPRLGFSIDRNYGYSIIVQTSTDLLHLPGFKKKKKTSLLADLAFRKSLDEPFRSLAGGVELVHPVYKEESLGWSLGTYYTDQWSPMGTGEFKMQRIRAFANIDGSLKNQALHKYVFGVAYSFSKTGFSANPNAKTQNAEDNLQLHAAGDGRLGEGFDRLSVYFDAGSSKDETTDITNSYQRLAWRLGYGISFGNSHNLVDLETSAGMGFSWGTVPAYNQFYAGNTLANFLYSPLHSAQMQSFPTGPLLRSLGEREGGFHSSTGSIEGGSSYWNLSISISIPIAKWARPLVPDLIVDSAEVDETGAIVTPAKTMRTKLKGMVRFAQTLIETDLADRDGLSDEAATAAAEKIINRDVRPAIFYLADRANVYSIKPVILFDLANMTRTGTSNTTWGAAGVGIQLNIVNARLQVGYAHTLFPSADRSKGNFLLRFNIQDFF